MKNVMFAISDLVVSAAICIAIVATLTVIRLSNKQASK